MDNFFSTNSQAFNNAKKPQDNSLNSQFDNLKDNYEQIFIEAAEIIRREVNQFKPENPCEFIEKKLSIQRIVAQITDLHNVNKR